MHEFCWWEEWQIQENHQIQDSRNMLIQKGKKLSRIPFFATNSSVSSCVSNVAASQLPRRNHNQIFFYPIASFPSPFSSRSQKVPYEQKKPLQRCRRWAWWPSSTPWSWWLTRLSATLGKDSVAWNCPDNVSSLLNSNNTTIGARGHNI